MSITRTNHISLPFTSENLKNLLHEVCDDQNEFTHQQLVYWCEKYILQCPEYMLDEKSWQEGLKQDQEREKAKAFAVAQDITWQWYKQMMKECMHEEWKEENIPYLQLPKGLFVKWLNDLYAS